MLFEYYQLNKVVMTKNMANYNALTLLLVLALTSPSLFFGVESARAYQIGTTAENNVLPFMIDSDPGKNNIHKISQFSDDNTFEVPATSTQLEILKPVAEPGWLQSVKSNDLVELDGSTSFDPNNSELTYAWTQVMGPDVILDDNLSEKPTFTAPKTSKDVYLTFQLVVSNEYGITSEPDYVTVFVN
jgi:hypothetical protein